MRIAILGSWRERDKDEWGHTGSAEEFAKGCYELGRALGMRDELVLAGGSSPETADYHVVRGIFDTARSRSLTRPLVKVIRPRSEDVAYRDLIDQYPELFVFQTPTEKQWIDVHYLAIEESDAVITIGGAGGTYREGLATIRFCLRKRLVPICSFGGSSLELARTLRDRGRPEFEQLSGPWNQHTLKTALRLAGVTEQPRVLMIHGTHDDRFALAELLRRILPPSNVVVMTDTPPAGKSLPEKFEELADQVDAAIALLTPDDLGGPADQDSSAYKLRARQNVWLEIGWFWGRLGRNKVLLMRRSDTEIPSDLLGEEYVPYTTTPTEQSEAIRHFIQRVFDPF